MLGMEAADASRADQPYLQCMWGHGIFLPRTLKPDGSQILPVTLGACFRATHAGENILLHDNPAAIASHMKPVSDGGERHAALAQSTKHPVAYRREITQAIGTGLPADLRLRCCAVT